MYQFKFTPEGVEALCLQLYRLSDAELAIETAALQNNFQKWMTDHFLLSPDQQVYLQQINPDVVRFIAVNSSFAFKNRLPVLLVKPAMKGARDSKITKPETNLTAEILPDGNYRASGEFIVEVSY